jgi:hypothetical protein
VNSDTITLLRTASIRLDEMETGFPLYRPAGTRTHPDGEEEPFLPARGILVHAMTCIEPDAPGCRACGKGCHDTEPPAYDAWRMMAYGDPVDAMGWEAVDEERAREWVLDLDAPLGMQAALRVLARRLSHLEKFDFLVGMDDVEDHGWTVALYSFCDEARLESRTWYDIEYRWRGVKLGCTPEDKQYALARMLVAPEVGIIQNQDTGDRS